jgi:hypothetical protein
VRDQIENSNKTLKERIVISYQTANLSDYDFLEKASIGTFLLSGRLAGYFTLNQSLQIADKKVSHLFQNPHKTINNHFSMKKGSLSTGFMGFFIILFNSLWIGGILGIIVIFFYAKFLLYIKNNIISLLILLITFLIFIDGPIDNFGILFKVVFSIIFLKLICFQTDLKKN